MERSILKLVRIITVASLCTGIGAPLFGQTAQTTRTILALPPGQLYAGEPLSFVSAIQSASTVSGGQVTFSDGSTAIATAPVTSGMASATIPGLSQGTHQISATFSGMATAAASTSAVYPLVISATGAGPTVSCTPATSNVNQGDSTTITETASSSSNLPVTDNISASAGTVTENGNTATLNVGSATGTIQVTCSATDSLGHTSTANTTVYVNTGQGEQALTAFNFTDSVGVNVHLHFGNTQYVTDFPDLMKSMVTLGIHHYRNGIDPYAQPFEYANAETLAQAGIKADWNIDRSDTPADINAIYANAPDSVEAFEGPNEDNIDVGAPLAAIMSMIHDTVRGNPNTASIPIYNATLSDLNILGEQSNLGAWADYGNMHDYYYPRYPETPAYGGVFYGCGAYGTMAFNICLTQLTAVGKPVVSTETGYMSGTQSDAVLAKYTVRTLFEHLSLNVMRTYIYEMLEDPDSPGYGLVNSDFSPKPAYTAIKNLITLFNDQSFSTPGKLEYTLGGQTANLYHVLFQKKDGTFMLVLWQGVASASGVAPYQTYSIQAEPVTVTTSTPVGAATISTLDDNGNLTTQAAPSGNPLTVQVTDQVTVVSFAPAQ